MVKANTLYSLNTIQWCHFVKIGCLSERDHKALWHWGHMQDHTAIRWIPASRRWKACYNSSDLELPNCTRCKCTGSHRPWPNSNVLTAFAWCVAVGCGLTLRLGNLAENVIARYTAINYHPSSVSCLNGGSSWLRPVDYFCWLLHELKWTLNVLEEEGYEVHSMKCTVWTCPQCEFHIFTCALLESNRWLDLADSLSLSPLANRLVEFQQDHTARVPNSLFLTGQMHPAWTENSCKKIVTRCQVVPWAKTKANGQDLNQLHRYEASGDLSDIY